MSNMNRLAMDRRCGDDRRKSYRLGYFINGGVERRSGKERRLLGERRIGWVRATEWSSVPGIVANTAQGDTVDNMPSNQLNSRFPPRFMRRICSSKEGDYGYRQTKSSELRSPNGDKRSGIERRRFSYHAHIPERRSGLDRRAGMRRELLLRVMRK